RARCERRFWRWRFRGAPCVTVAGVVSHRAAGLMASLLPGLGGCLLYTNEINEAPTAAIEAPTLEPPRGMRTLISARVHDDKDPADRLAVRWVAVDGACPSRGEASPPGGARSSAG